jgi:8-amino-7-oxononanoate synthase
MDLFEKCYQPLLAMQMKEAGFDAYYRVIQSVSETEVEVDGRKLIMLGSNNYLGLATDPRVKRAAIEAVERYGAGMAGSRCLNGTTELHADLEKRLARFLRRDAAIYYTSGYLANLGVISSLAQRGDFVLVDRHAHASLHDGARLAQAESMRFRHNDMNHLERLLDRCGDAGKLVVVDGVYSMEGEIAPLPRIVETCRKHGARLLVDDAHGLGVLGRDGRGTAEHFGLEDEVDIIVGTASKTLPGVGGFAAARQEIVDFLKNAPVNRPFMLAASPPAAAVAGVRAALEIIEQEPALRRKLWDSTRRVLHALRTMGFDTGHSQTPIIPISTGEIGRTFAIWKMLTDDGFFVNVVIPPAVPAGACLIRLTLTANHTKEQLDLLLSSVQRAGVKLGFIAPPPGYVAEGLKAAG